MSPGFEQFFLSLCAGRMSATVDVPFILLLFKAIALHCEPSVPQRKKCEGFAAHRIKEGEFDQLHVAALTSYSAATFAHAM